MTATVLVCFRLNFFSPRERTCACHEERASHSLVHNGVGDVMIHVTDKLEESHWLIIFQSKARASLSNSKIDRDISKLRRKRHFFLGGKLLYSIDTQTSDRSPLHYIGTQTSDRSPLYSIGTQTSDKRLFYSHSDIRQKSIPFCRH